MSNSSEIYAQGYEKWEGERHRDIPAWFLIGQAALRNLVSSSGCLVRTLCILGFGIYYFIVGMSALVHFQFETLKKWDFFRAFSVLSEQTAIEVTEIMIHKHLIMWPSLSFTLITMIIFGSQLISKDKRSNALQVYFSKAISRLDYVAGKLFAVAILVSLTTMVPSAMIILMGIVLAPDHSTFLQQSWYIPIVTGTYWLVLTLVVGGISLTFSSLFSRGYMAAVGIIGFIFFSSAFSALIIKIIGSSHLIKGFNMILSLKDIGNALFDLEVSSGGRLTWQVIDMGIIVALAFILVFKKIRPVEVIS